MLRMKPTVSLLESESQERLPRNTDHVAAVVTAHLEVAELVAEAGVYAVVLNERGRRPVADARGALLCHPLQHPARTCVFTCLQAAAVVDIRRLIVDARRRISHANVRR